MEKQPVGFSATVLIIGAGPAGLATAACLTSKLISVLILEREDTVASLWRYRTYDRLHLHLKKHYCELPLLPFPPSTPAFPSCADFVRYLDNYAASFRLENLLRLRRRVDSARFDPAGSGWRVDAVNLETGALEKYESRFLVVATGENDEPVLPADINGLDRFTGETVHAHQFRTGKAYKGLDVLVVGSGNSGMEITCDLTESGARASIVVRSEVHLVTREIWALAMSMMKHLPIALLDFVILFFCYFWFGNTSKYGLNRPKKGPFYLKYYSPFYPVMDAGTFAKIKSGEIEVLPAISAIDDKNVTFQNGKQRCFDVIIFATGYRSAVKKWLKGDNYLLDDNGMAKQEYPMHWKGNDGLYCSGLARRGLFGIAEDAKSIADDINNVLHNDKQKIF